MDGAERGAVTRAGSYRVAVGSQQADLPLVRALGTIPLFEPAPDGGWRPRVGP